MDYDLGRVEISSHYKGEMLHVFSNRENKTGPRSVFLVRDYSVYVCHMRGNPAVKDEFKIEETRPINRQEANWLLNALVHAERDPGMGLTTNVRQIRNRVREATFWVRFQSDVSVIQEV